MKPFDGLQAQRGKPRDPVILASAGLFGLCLLLLLAGLVSAEARGVYEAGYTALYEAMAGMAAACQWTY